MSPFIDENPESEKSIAFAYVHPRLIIKLVIGAEVKVSKRLGERNSHEQLH